MKITTNYKTIHRIAYWIAKSWFSSVPNSVTIAQTWINQVEAWHKANGPIWTIKYIKMIRFIVLSKLSGNGVKTVDMIVGINRSNCLPKSITHMHGLIESGNYKQIRFVLSMLSISRLIPGWVAPDLSSIEGKISPNQMMIKSLTDYMGLFISMYNMKEKLPSNYDRRELLFSSKAGPNGAATRTALYDLKMMPEILKNILMQTNLGPIMQEYDELLSKSRVEKYHAVQQLWYRYQREKLKLISFFDDRSLWPKPHMRKLSIVKDPEAKSRIIAILDWWSQQYLRQIHKIHFKYLERIPMDRTFTQDPIITNKPEGHKYYSFDLTAATDRFPIELQINLIEKMFGTDTATSWRMILTSFPFYVPWEDREVYYSSGQPMGAYSSWTTFTLCHHLILHKIHHDLKLDNYYYQILGDDIVIYHDDVARMYQDIMKELDVGISLPKSHISSNMYEFAKRVFISGKEVTGIQLRGLYNNHSKYHLLYQMVYELIITRGYLPDGFSSIPDLLSELFVFIGKGRKVVANLKVRTTLLHSFNKYLHGDITPLQEFIKRRYYNYEGQLSLPELQLNNLVYLAMHQTVLKVNAEYMDYAKDLISRPSSIEQAAIGLADQADMWTSPIYYLTKHPMMEALANTIYALNRSWKQESIKDLVRAIALPDINVFEKRGSTRLIGAQAKLAKIFLAQLESNVIRGRPAHFPDPTLTRSVMDHMERSIRTYQIDKSYGLVPPAPKPKPKPIVVDYLSTPMW